MSDCLCLDQKKCKFSFRLCKHKSQKQKSRIDRVNRTESRNLVSRLHGTCKFEKRGLSHHLRRLKKTESIKVERLPRQTRFYPRNFSDEKSVIAKALRKKTPRDIIYALMLNDADDKNGLEFSQIISNVSKSPSTVSLYLSQLIQDDVVRIILDFGRKRKYQVSDKRVVSRMIEKHKPRMLEQPVSGFEDMINSL